MKTAYVLALVLLAFAAGAFLSGVSANPGGMSMMGGGGMNDMMDACARMMEDYRASSS